MKELLKLEKCHQEYQDRFKLNNALKEEVQEHKYKFKNIRRMDSNMRWKYKKFIKKGLEREKECCKTEWYKRMSK